MALSNTYRLFLFGLMLVSGLFYCFVVPPFQTPDEFNHNYKIHHLVQGHFFPEIDTPSVSLGGFVPKSLVDISEHYKKMVFEPRNKLSFDTLKKHLAIPLNHDEQVFVSFPNTARYAFMSYIALIPVVYIADKMSINPMITLYIGRLINFLVWFGLIVIGYRLLPIFKDFYLFLCLLPNTLSIHASMSADNINNGLLFILIALFLDFKFSEKIISPTKLVFFGIITLIVAWNKIIYFPLLFLLFLVPKNYFEKVKSRNAYIFTVLFGVMTIILMWNKTVDKFIYPFEDTYKTTYHNLREDDDDPTAFIHINPRLQIENIKKEPISFILSFIPSVFDMYSYNNQDYISGVGWDSRHMYIGLHAIFLILFFLYIFYLPPVFSRTERWVMVALAYGMSALFLLSQHLHWGKVGTDINTVYLGKYFIAIYPLLFFALSGLLFKYKKLKLKTFNLAFIVSIVLILAHIDMYFVTLDRFYE
jgi:uncharacterized membrane protein